MGITLKKYLFMYRWLLGLLSVLFLATGLVLFAWSGVFGDIDPENLDRQTLIRVIQLRDFHRFSPDLVERLTDRAEQEFGRQSPNKPVFEFPHWEKKIHLYFYARRSNRHSRMEANLTAMARVRYFHWMREYQSATEKPDRQAALMNEVVADMRYWQTIYSDYMHALEQPEPTLIELHQDFVRMIESFKVAASPEEIAQIDSFAQDLSRALFVAEAQKTILNIFSPFKRK